SDDPRAEFRDRLGVSRTYYSFDARGYHFVLLDSIRVVGGELKYHGDVDPEQLEWLKEDLSKLPSGQPVVAVTHIPLLTAFYQATEGTTFPAPANRVVVNNRDVLEVFRDYNLILVLQGHLHVSEQLRWRDTTFITGGAICGKWWRGAWQGTDEGFTVVTLQDDRIESEYVTYGWRARRPPNA
nr:metallophosphoesterase [Gammaproteobacteria bacterium]